MFIDECEGVFARRGGTNTDAASEELVQAFLAEWDGVGSEDQRVWVVGATNRKDIMDDAITSTVRRRKSRSASPRAPSGCRSSGSR